jgi:hypothetical protein
MKSLLKTIPLLSILVTIFSSVFQGLSSCESLRIKKVWTGVLEDQFEIVG